MTSGRIDDPERLQAVRRSALIDTDPEVVSHRGLADDALLLAFGLSPSA